MNEAYCEWMIAPPQASLITLTLTELSTQTGKDTLKVLQCTDISCSQQQQLAEFSGWYSAAPSATVTTGFMKVVFTSDATVNFDGFTASWTSVSHIVLYIDIHACFVITIRAIYLRTYMECWIHIYCPVLFAKETYIFISILIIEGQPTAFLSIQFRKPALKSKNSIIRQLGTVSFYTNSSFTHSCVSQVSLPCAGCTSCKIHLAANGTFSDGSGSSNYLDSTSCEWLIAPPGALLITLSFTELSTQAGKDFVRVWQCTDIACSQQLQLAEISGTYSEPQVVTSTTGFMKVAFTSDASVAYDGFTASWTSVRP
jgi:hypothetical protein